MEIIFPVKYFMSKYILHKIFYLCFPSPIYSLIYHYLCLRIFFVAKLLYNSPSVHMSTNRKKCHNFIYSIIFIFYYLSIYPSANLFIHLLFKHPSICIFIQSYIIYPSINPFCIFPSNPLTIHLFIYLSIRLFVHLSKTP